MSCAISSGLAPCSSPLQTVLLVTFRLNRVPCRTSINTAPSALCVARTSGDGEGGRIKILHVDAFQALGPKPSENEPGRSTSTNEVSNQNLHPSCPNKQ